jgi:hypothetical protein
MDHPSLPRRVPVPSLDAVRGNTGERLERHLALLGRAPGDVSAAGDHEATALIQQLVPRAERGERAPHRLARVSLLAPLRGRHRRIAL